MTVVFGLLCVLFVVQWSVRLPLGPAEIQHKFCSGRVEDCAFVAKALDMLPQDCRRNVHSVTIRYDDPELAGFTTTYGDVWFAGDLLTSHPSEFRANIVHECGHIVDFLFLTGNPRSPPTPFTFRTLPTTEDDPSLGFYAISWSDSFTKKPGVSAKDFVSGYAQMSAIEDFAESYAYLILQRGAFETRARRRPALRLKLQYMKSLLPSTFTIALGQAWNGKIPGTVSGLSYDWAMGA